VEWSGVEWSVSGVEWSGVEWSGVEWSGVEWSGVELSSHLISSHLISSHLISSHLISSHLNSTHCTGVDTGSSVAVGDESNVTAVVLSGAASLPNDDADAASVGMGIGQVNMAVPWDGDEDEKQHSM
jgi:hypothetical protein